MEVKETGVLERIDGFEEIGDRELILGVVVAPLVSHATTCRISMTALAVERAAPFKDRALRPSGIVAATTIVSFE